MRLRRIRRLPRADWGKAVAHIGLGVTIFGIAAILAWQKEDSRIADIGERRQVGECAFRLDAVQQGSGPNYLTTMADISVWQDDRQIGNLVPEKRFYAIASMPTTEAANISGVLRDIYVVVGDPQDGGGWAMRVYVKPFALWFWSGAILMALGGLMSLTDRRLRVGAVLEQRARDVSKGLRCPVCRNESIDESNAAIAKELRIVLRERIMAGDTNQEAIDFIVARFGEFVLLRPDVRGANLVPWTAPPIMLLIALLVGWSAIRAQCPGPRP